MWGQPTRTANEDWSLSPLRLSGMPSNEVSPESFSTNDRGPCGSAGCGRPLGTAVLGSPEVVSFGPRGNLLVCIDSGEPLSNAGPTDCSSASCPSTDLDFGESAPGSALHGIELVQASPRLAKGLRSFWGKMIVPVVSPTVVPHPILDCPALNEVSPVAVD
jgi:hypothetical protein